jgi:hypothetical protein
MVFQDGHAYVAEDGAFRVPIVFDNQIHQRALPVTIGLFINPGHSGKAPPETPWQSDQRSSNTVHSPKILALHHRRADPRGRADASPLR